jgi:hypothetical protein
MGGDEYATFPPLPCDRYPAAGHPLPDLRPHPRPPARQHQRGLDRALPPGPSRSPRHSRRVNGSRPSAAEFHPDARHLAAWLAADLGPQPRQRSQSAFGALLGGRAKSRRYGRQLHRERDHLHCARMDILGAVSRPLCSRAGRPRARGLSWMRVFPGLRRNVSPHPPALVPCRRFIEVSRSLRALTGVAVAGHTPATSAPQEGRRPSSPAALGCAAAAASAITPQALTVRCPSAGPDPGCQDPAAVPAVSRVACRAVLTA